MEPTKLTPNLNLTITMTAILLYILVCMMAPTSSAAALPNSITNPRFVPISAPEDPDVVTQCIGEFAACTPGGGSTDCCPGFICRKSPIEPVGNCYRAPPTTTTTTVTVSPTSSPPPGQQCNRKRAARRDA